MCIMRVSRWGRCGEGVRIRELHASPYAYVFDCHQDIGLGACRISPHIRARGHSEMENGESGVGPDPVQESWDRFVPKANHLIESVNMVKWEIEYKLEIGCKVAAAREAVLWGTDNWADSLKKALLANQPVHMIDHSKFSQWCRNSPEDARRALEAIWTQESLSSNERIRAFRKLFPLEVIGGRERRGSRTTLISALMMGLDVERYPPFRIGLFSDAYKRTGYPQPERLDCEAALYEHSLEFLDNFIREAQAHGVYLRHRLDAQSVVWQLPNDLPLLGSPPTVDNLEALADELLLDVEFLGEIEALLMDKRQVIFQGPPGTGKTYVAQALANCLAGWEDQVTLVQFHPSYAYEDFVRGFRPSITENGQAGFELRDGPLLRAAEKARKDKDSKHFLIIDEINRGNIAKVFGELYFLLEYRDKKIRMQYQEDGEDHFSLPRNLYIIGTMNTADRSIALVDLALRRRFHFIEFHPDNDPIKSLLGLWLEKEAPEIRWTADVVREANVQLEEYKHAAIGPSYFMRKGLQKEDVPRIWKPSVLPYIEELLFGDDKKIQQLQFKTLCGKAAPHIKWNDDQKPKDSSVDSVSGTDNNAKDQLEGT
ncbi:MAG: AAA domain-containing protein [Caldilineaceae bacterium SB0675_bin_29]|uniref:AAA domain-containing protein n=1 Tax=Caldilineaceae bacterium SB0675_bin_29 TaxID=2605266 RepID=A0A6B1G2P2_9CHLR|nr:AAA domain-containing protein [Caldilineaceae bacterium SB0675_bin_29]